MVELHLVAQFVDDLFERFDALGHLRIGLDECLGRKTQDLLYGLRHDGQLGDRLVGEMDLLLVDLLIVLRDVSRVVGDSLEVRERMQEERCGAALCLGQLLTGETHEVRTEGVFVVVADRLEFADLVESRFVIVIEKP